jgi:GNAT superfamily N-acetyltransferase
MQIVPADPSDAATMTAIALAAKRHWHYPEAWIETWRDDLTFTPEGIGAHPTYQLVEDDSALAVYRLKIDGSDAELIDLGGRPSAMGRGMGRQLFQHAEHTARLHHCTRLHLASAPHAEAFYLHLGLQRFGEQNAQMDHLPRVLPLLEKRLRVR